MSSKVDEALVVSKVHIGLSTIAGDEDLAMLVGGHGPWVDVEVGIELHHGDGDAAVLEDTADGSDSNALAY